MKRDTILTIALPTQDETSRDTGWPGHGPQTVPSLAVSGETDVGGEAKGNKGADTETSGVESIPSWANGCDTGTDDR